MNRDSWILGGATGALLPLAALLCGWFGLHTHSFAAAVEEALDKETRPRVFSVGQVAWGPGPFEFTAFDVVMRDRAGAQLVRAGRVHAKVELSDLALEEHDIRLFVPSVEIDDFDLVLRWDYLGDLTLVEPFSTKSFGLGREKPKPTFVAIDLPDITLRRGTLHLAFDEGDFGFTFRDIDTAGAVHVHDDDLDIRVAALDAADSTAWIAGAPAGLATRLSAALPPNAVTSSTPEGLRVPFGDVRIRDFAWAGDGFRAGLDLSVTDGGHVHAEGLMDFPKAGTVHQVSAQVEMPGKTVHALSGGHVSGPLSLALTTDGLDLGMRLSLGPLSADALRFGDVALDRVALDRLDIDTRTDGSVAFVGSLGAARIGAFAEATDLRLAATARIGWPGWSLEGFLGDLSSDPLAAALPLVTGDGAEGTLDAMARTARVGRGGDTWRDVAVEALRVRAGSGSVTGRVRRATLSDPSGAGQGVAAAELGTSFEIGLSGLSGEIALTVTFRDVPLALLRRVLPGDPQLTSRQGPRASGRVMLTAPITKPASLHVSSVALEPGP